MPDCFENTGNSNEVVVRDAAENALEGLKAAVANFLSFATRSATLKEQTNVCRKSQMQEYDFRNRFSRLPQRVLTTQKPKLKLRDYPAMAPLDRVGES